MEKPQEPPDKVTVVEQVYHQSSGNNPYQFSTGFCRRLKTKEQTYQRTTTVGTDWEPLDCGWLYNISLLEIKNEEGKPGQFHMDDDDRAETAKRIISLRFGVVGQWPHILIPPGESCRFSPVSVHAIYISSQHGTARYTLTAIPE